MTLAEFETSTKHSTPPEDASPLLQSLWWDAREDWHQAHELAQDIHSKEGSWIHAYLHRKEGDLANAGYWYRKAGREVYQGSLQEEWRDMARNFLGV